MASDLRFYKTIITVEVLSEEEYSEDDLRQIAHDTFDGPCSGTVSVGESIELNGIEAAEALIAQGSDPGFFNLTETGEDADWEPETFQVEYDLSFFGGDYTRVGNFVTITPDRNESVEHAFTRVTGHHHQHIVSYQYEEALVNEPEDEQEES